MTTENEGALIVHDRRSAATVADLPAPIPAGELTQETVLLQVIARAAQDRSIDLDRMERLLGMQERLSAQRAEREFIDAMARFKESAPDIIKDKSVGYTNRDGTFTGYCHATLGAVCAAAIGGLAKVGISHRWDVEQSPDGTVRVTCVLAHVGGHHTSTWLSGAPDDSGKKNSIQQVASTITYLQRYTLLAATGLATREQDDDGARASSGFEPVSEEQVANIRALMTEVAANEGKLLLYLKVESLEDIPAKEYSAVIKLLEAKRK